MVEVLAVHQPSDGVLVGASENTVKMRNVEVPVREVALRGPIAYREPPPHADGQRIVAGQVDIGLHERQAAGRQADLIPEEAAIECSDPAVLLDRLGVFVRDGDLRGHDRRPPHGRRQRGAQRPDLRHCASPQAILVTIRFWAPDRHAATVPTVATYSITQGPLPKGHT
jgi:hypothetical protein